MISESERFGRSNDPRPNVLQGGLGIVHEQGCPVGGDLPLQISIDEPDEIVSGWRHVINLKELIESH